MEESLARIAESLEGFRTVGTIACFWMGVGSVNPCASMPFSTRGSKPKCEKSNQCPLSRLITGRLLLPVALSVSVMGISNNSYLRAKRNQLLEVPL